MLQLLNVGSIDEAIIKIKNFSDRQISIQKAQMLSYFMLSGDKIVPYEKLKLNFEDAQWKNKNKEHVQKLCQAFGL